MSRVERWERRAEVPLMLLALAFLVAYVWPVLDPRLDAGLRSFLEIVSWTVWAAFGIDFAIRLALAEDRVPYAVRHWYDVALILLPMIRPLRLLRLIALARVLDRAAADSFAGKTLVYVGGAAALATGLAAVAVLDAERGAPRANIQTFGDAIWWAATTVTSVGYGDHYPVTGEGRVVAVTLMLVGIGFIGTVMATVASWMIERTSLKDESEAER
ncbi:MAG TPA: potassium channel family protein [Aeromicrobium sp.]|nr:potassium channel family protein [Aeromicrobium sp.]